MSRPSSAFLILALLAWVGAPLVVRAVDDAQPRAEHKGDHQHDKAAKKADAGHDTHGTGDHGHGGNTIFPWALDLGLWSLVVFLGLLFILRKAAWGPMLEGLRKREESIRLAVEEAKLVRVDMERARAEHRAEMEKAYAEIPKIMEEARRDASRLIDEAKAKANSDILADRQRLRRELEMARDQAIQQLWEQAAQLATLISARAIRRNLTEDDKQRLTNEALEEINQAAEQWKRDTKG